MARKYRAIGRANFRKEQAQRNFEAEQSAIKRAFDAEENKKARDQRSEDERLAREARSADAALDRDSRERQAEMTRINNAAIADNNMKMEQAKLAQRKAEHEATLAETKRANEAKEKANQSAIESAKEESFLDNYKDLNFINMGLQDPEAVDASGKKDPVNLSAIASQMRKIELDNRIKERLVEYAKTALGLTDEAQIQAALSNTTADPNDNSKPFITQGTRDNLAREIIRDYSADIKENTDRVMKDGLAALSVEARKFANQKKASTGKLPTETEVNSFLKQRAKAIFGVD